MSQGFKTKSADELQNARSQRKSKEIADIGSIQQSLVEHFIDAMGTQTEIAKQIVAKKADYVLGLKANHPTLKYNNGLKLRKPIISEALMSVMTNELRKHIIAEKFVKFGLYLLLLLASFINPNYG